MKIIIFCFSGTGNTSWASKELNRLLIDRGHNSDVIAIDSIKDISEAIIAIDKCDYVGFANPIYGADIPKVMRLFIVSLIDKIIAKDIQMSKIFFINTYGYVNGFGIYRTKKIFKNMNTTITGYVNIKLFNNVSSIKSNKKITEAKIKNKKQVVINKMNNFVIRMEESHTYINGIGPHLLMGGIIRRLLRKGLNNSYTAFVVDGDICTDCMLCINKCPTNSIEKVDSKYIFNSTCTSCMRCYNICPFNALKLEKNGNEKNIARYKGIGD